MQSNSFCVIFYFYHKVDQKNSMIVLKCYVYVTPLQYLHNSELLGGIRRHKQS